MPKVAYWAPDDELTALERIAGCAAEHKKGDRHGVAPVMANSCCRVSGITFPEFSRDPYLAFQSFIATNEIVGHDIIVPLVDLSIDSANFHIGDFYQPIVYPQHDVARVDYDDSLIKSPDDYDRIEFSDVRKEGSRTKYYADMMHYLGKYFIYGETRFGNKHPVTPVLYDPIGTLGTLRGVERMFVDIRKHKEKVKIALDIITDEEVEQTKAICDAGCAVLYLITLFSANILMSRNQWLEWGAPGLGTLAKTVDEHPGVTRKGLHNCCNGVYWDLCFRATGSGPHNPMSFAFAPDDCEDAEDPDACTLEKYGKTHCFLYGYVSPATYMYLGTPHDVEMETKRQMDALGKDGDFVVATGCEFPPNGPIWNAIAQVGASFKYGRFDGKTTPIPWEWKDWGLPERMAPAPPPLGWEEMKKTFDK